MKKCTSVMTNIQVFDPEVPFPGCTEKGSWNHASGMAIAEFQVGKFSFVVEGTVDFSSERCTGTATLTTFSNNAGPLPTMIRYREYPDFDAAYEAARRCAWLEAHR